MKAWIPLTLVLALGTAAVAQADCAYPRAPDAPPDGNTATKDQMIAAKHDFDRYNGEMNSYLDCLKLEMDAAAPKDPKKPTADEKKQAAILVQKNNAAVDELQAVVGRFNEQLKIYKAKAAAAPKS
jgi:signal recognition particle subunit SEC65